MAIGAGNGGVPSGQRESGLRVPRRGECRRLEAGHGVAEPALIGIGGMREFSRMRIRVAGGASELAGRVHRRLAPRRMTFGAFEQGVLSFQGECALAVCREVESGRLEAGVVMTSRAVVSGGACGELPVVRVLVAIRATLVREGPPKIAALVALRAGLLRMLPDERKLRDGVAKARPRAIILPSAGVVAVVADPPKPGLAECRAMRVYVTALTSAEREPGESRPLFGGFGPVAFLAGHCLMQTRQRKASPGVIEALCRFPRILRMAAGALLAQLTAVPVLMAGRALLAEAQEGRVEIFHFDLGAGGGRQVFFDVTGLAWLFAVFAFETERGLRKVVECLSVQAN